MWCFTLSTFLSNDWNVRLGQVMFEYNLYPFFSIIAGKNLFTLRASLLLSSSNDASADTADDEGSFAFSSNAELISLLHVHISYVTDTDAAALHLIQLLSTTTPKAF